MKALLLVLPFFATLAFAAPIPTKPLEQKNILKCFSAKHGTLWATFGHAIKSGEDKVTHFPTEIAVFKNTSAARNVYFDIKEALKVDLQVRPRAVHLGFDLTVVDSKQTHLLQIMETDFRNPNSYAGNWTVTENDKSVPDAVYCSVY